MTGAVLIAANMKSPEGDNVSLKMLGSISVVERVVSTFMQAGVGKIVLVSGEQAAEIEKKIAHMGVICMRNEAYETSDMFASAKIGLAYLEKSCEKIAVCPVDIPLFTVDTVKKLFASEAKVISPSNKKRGGHPMVLDKTIVPDILNYTGAGGLKEAIRIAGIKREWLEVEDDGSLLDIAKKEASNVMISAHTKQMLHPAIKITIAKERVFMGPGAMQLLELIEDTGSVRNACQLMNISYSKGFKILRAMEEQWGHPVVESRQGGTTGGSSCITESGKDLMERYRKYQSKVKEMALELFDTYFGNL